MLINAKNNYKIISSKLGATSMWSQMNKFINEINDFISNLTLIENKSVEFGDVNKNCLNVVQKCFSSDDIGKLLLDVSYGICNSSEDLNERNKL